MKKLASSFSLSVFFLLVTACTIREDPPKSPENELREKTRVIFDTDANNEVDDQHALAYLLFNGDHFYLEGVTVNATSSYEDAITYSKVEGHYNEALRVLKLCGRRDTIVPLFTGTQGSFSEIKNHINDKQFDGFEAVNFIIEAAMNEQEKELVLVAVGKLTNIALALLKEPEIAKKIRIVWLGSNYPDPGEHNMEWDIEAMNYVLKVDVPFELVTVGYRKPSGTAEVRVNQSQILHRMPGKGPQLDTAVIGRHGGEFYCWGDYSVDLFKRYHMWGTPPSRSLFDLAAVAILKNPEWAETREIPAPIYKSGKWEEQPGNPRKIVIWEWFHIYAIVGDFFQTMDDYKLVCNN